MKKILIVAMAVVMTICAFAMTACGDSDCPHLNGAYITKFPTLEEAGECWCIRCKKSITLPKLNTTDYTKNDNPDYVVYTYILNVNVEFNIVEHSNFEFESYGNGYQYQITKYTGNNAIVRVPDTVYTYTNQGEDRYSDMPRTIDCIGSEVFKDNTNLEELVIPDSVHSPNRILNGCTSLRKLTMRRCAGRFYELFATLDGDDIENVPDSLKEVVLTQESGDFSGCDKIEKITVLGGENTGFYSGCTSLKEVTLSPSVTTINENTFENCSNLTDVVIPASVMDLTIRNGAFKNCNADVYYRGSESNLNVDGEVDSIKFYYYSDTAPGGVEYLNNKKTIETWHYNDSNEKVLWQPNFTTNVSGKTFNYDSSTVKFSDAYWKILKEAERQGNLEDLFDNDQALIDDVTSSRTKEEYEGKMAVYYASTATATAVSFIDGKLTLNTSYGSAQLDYIEVDGEVCCKIGGKNKVLFTYDNGTVYEKATSEHYTIRHIYVLAD